MAAMRAGTSASGSAPLQDEPMEDQPSTSGSVPPQGEHTGKQEKCALTIDDLPHELLLEVLSKINDGCILLGTVSRVCKRWHAAVSEAAAWRGVTLTVQANRTPSIEKTLLKKAPALGDLHISLADWPTTREDRPKLRFLQGLNQLIVHNEISVGPFAPRSLRKGYLELVWRSRNHLKELSIVLDNTTKTSQRHSSVYVLSQMHCLEKLTVFLDIDFVYEKGQLQQGFPNLKTLVIPENKTGSHHYDLMKDLLRDGIESVRFPHVTEPTPELLAALVRCRELNDLVVHWEFAPVFCRLPALKTVFAHYLLYSPSEIARIEQAFQSLYTPTLRFVNVKVWWKNYDCCWSEIFEACHKGVKAVKNQGYNGKIMYQIY